MRDSASSRIQRPYQRISSASPCAPFHATCGSRSGFTGGQPANLGGISQVALETSTATGLRSEPCARSPSRCASSGIEPPPQKGSQTGGACSASHASTASGSSRGGGSPPRPRASERAISYRASFKIRSSFVASHGTIASTMPCSRLSSRACSASVGNSSGHADGSSTSCANSTARHAASGRLAHHRCNVDGCPCRIDFSRADALLMASSGSETSMSFLRWAGGTAVKGLLQMARLARRRRARARRRRRPVLVRDFSARPGPRQPGQARRYLRGKGCPVVAMQSPSDRSRLQSPR